MLGIVRNDRLACEKGKSGSRAVVGINRNRANHVRFPTDTGADQKLFVWLNEFKHLGPFYAQTPRNQGGTLGQKGVELISSERLDAELCNSCSLGPGFSDESSFILDAGHALARK